MGPLLLDGRLRAGDERARVDEVSNPVLVDPDGRVRIAVREVAGPAGVVEVGVGREDPREVGWFDPERVERLDERVDICPRSGVDHGRLRGVIDVDRSVSSGVEHPGIVNVEVRNAADRFELVGVHVRVVVAATYASAGRR